MCRANFSRVTLGGCRAALMIFIVLLSVFLLAWNCVRSTRPSRGSFVHSSQRQFKHSVRTDLKNKNVAVWRAQIQGS